MSFSIQKANFWKRFSAWLVDSVLVLLLAVTCSLPLLNILGFYENNDKIKAITLTYQTQIEAEYNVSLNIDQETYDAFSQAEKDNYEAAGAALNKALNEDPTYNELTVTRVSLIMTDACISIFLGTILAHFVLPLILKNGQTLGKKTFGLAVIRSNGLKISSIMLFIRSVIGMFLIEIMAVAFLLLVYPVGTIAAALLQIMQIAIMIKTPNHSSIHDLLVDTAVVDFASQQIFDTQEELNEYIASEKAKELTSANRL